MTFATAIQKEVLRALLVHAEKPADFAIAVDAQPHAIRISISKIHPLDATGIYNDIIELLDTLDRRAAELNGHRRSRPATLSLETMNLDSARATIVIPADATWLNQTATNDKDTP